jgi:UDP-2,3-diacylglucosamine pyrophosphatase LpxH
MIQVAVFSDLHLEHYPNFEKFNRNVLSKIIAGVAGADHLILCGDIGTALNSRGEPNQLYKQCLLHLQSYFPRVIFVAGNHEFYKSDMR